MEKDCLNENNISNKQLFASLNENIMEKSKSDTAKTKFCLKLNNN